MRDLFSRLILVVVVVGALALYMALVWFAASLVVYIGRCRSISPSPNSP